MNNFIKFACVGFLGFCVDTFCFSLLYYTCDLQVMKARIIAFIFAANTTWLGNRLFTFRRKEKQDLYQIAKQWFQFMFVASFSLIPNLLVFKAVVSFSNGNDMYIYMALMLGILAGMITNYSFSSKWVFRKLKYSEKKDEKSLTY